MAALRFRYLATAADVACTYSVAPSTCSEVGFASQSGVCILWPSSVVAETMVRFATSAAGNAGPVYFQFGSVTSRPAMADMFIAPAWLPEVEDLPEDIDIPFIEEDDPDIDIPDMDIPDIDDDEEPAG